MNTMDTICKRKSVRTYTGKQITKEQLNTILKAAIAAPVGMGQYESVHLTIITNKDLLNKIDVAGAAMFGKPGHSPTLQCADAYFGIRKNATRGSNEKRYVFQCGNHCAKQALVATELGVGICHILGATMATLNAPDILKELNLSTASFLAVLSRLVKRTMFTSREKSKWIE